jgi:hypothetical protein
MERIQYLSIYTAIFEMAHNQKRITLNLLGSLFSYGSTFKDT